MNLFGSTMPVAATLEWLALLLFVGASIAATSSLSGTRQNVEDREFDNLTVNRLDAHPNERAHALAAEAAADCVFDAWSRASSSDSAP